MGRYHPTIEKKSGGLIILLSIVLIVATALVWIFFNEDIAVDIAKTDTKTLELPSPSKSAEFMEPLPGTPAPSDQVFSESLSGTGSSAENAGQDEPVDLPAIGSSDPFFREELLKLSPGLAPWLNTDQLIRKYMVIVNDFAQGLRLEKHMRFLKPKVPFSVEQDDGRLVIATASYQRYDRLAQAINLLDVPATLAVYQKTRLLLVQVFSEFSYPEGYSLDDIFTKAAAEILSAPVIDQRIALVRPSVNYQYADPQLEALNPVHKQMLRMGPENTQIIQNKVRRLVEGLVNRPQ